jgi:hypothetical protein
VDFAGAQHRATIEDFRTGIPHSFKIPPRGDGATGEFRSNPVIPRLGRPPRKRTSPPSGNSLQRFDSFRYRPEMLKMSSIALTAFLLNSCSPDPQYLHVVKTTKSPDGSFTAANVENTEGGAAVGTSFEVYVFTGSLPTRSSDRVFSDECVNDVQVTWLGPKELQISYGARPGHETAGNACPWWTFGRSPHGLTIHFASHASDATYC